ncbi:24051_t:CDS:2, partial [Cetraspora pellucida]
LKPSRFFSTQSQKIELLYTLLQSLNTNKLINIAIDRYAAVVKTSVGEAIQIFNEEQVLELINSIKHLDKEQYRESGIKAAQILTNDKLYDIINKTIRKIVKNKEFVVVEYDITTLCLPDAKVKIILSADVETHVA